MATSAMRVPAPPARRLRPGSNAQSRRSGSASPQFLPTHAEKDVRPIETHLRASAYQLKIIAFAIRATFAAVTRNCLWPLELNTIAVLYSHDIAVEFMSVFLMAEKQEIVQLELLHCKDDGGYQVC